VTRRGEVRLLRTVKKNCDKVLREITNDFNEGGVVRVHPKTIQRYLHKRSSLSSFDLRPILKTCLFICKRIADELKIESHIWGKFKRVTQDSLKTIRSIW
jgi:hypothetical protein